MKIKTSELTGKALAYAVAVAAGRWEVYVRDESRPGLSIMDIGLDENKMPSVYVTGNKREPYKPWSPHTDWSQGGPIIEREGIWISDPTGDCLHPRQWGALIKGTAHDTRGPTPLMAAMRCYVASKLGDEVEVPEVLL